MIEPSERVTWALLIQRRDVNPLLDIYTTGRDQDVVVVIVDLNFKC